MNSHGKGKTYITCMIHHILNHHKLIAMIVQHEICIPVCYSRLSCLQALLGSSNIGEKVTPQPDPDGLKFGNKHNIAVMKDGMTVGHLPKDISCLAKFFIVHRGTFKCKGTGKKKTFKRCCVAVWRCPGGTNLI